MEYTADDFPCALIMATMLEIEYLNTVTQRYCKLGKKVLLHHLSPDCIRLLINVEAIIDIIGDPVFMVVSVE